MLHACAPLAPPPHPVLRVIFVAQAVREGQAQAEDPGEAQHHQAGVERGVPTVGPRAGAPAAFPPHV